MGKMTCHPNFDKYVEMIVSHPNYNGLPCERQEDGKLKWVETGKSEKGRLRRNWWDGQCREHGITVGAGCYATVARQIHPTGLHVCQCCGKTLSIFYEYPTLPALKKINKYFGLSLKQTDCTMHEFVQKHCTTLEQVQTIASIFRLPSTNKEELLAAFARERWSNKCRMLSPGVMSNSPDRFDGFHSYGLCCRKSKDRGRSTENMKSYLQDRRAYENWAEGNYSLANHLMGAFHKCPSMACPVCGKVAPMTADHIGPISLGFCHSIHFAPMCKECNSSKNNRFTKADVDRLLQLEAQGETVVSWHSRHIWDMLKHEIHTDEDAKRASALMAKCHQNVLHIFAIIHEKTGREFLCRYLHPEYSLMDYQFENLDLSNLSTLRIVERPKESKNKQKNQQRYVRVSFEKLAEFSKKGNRKTSFLVNGNAAAMRKLVKLITTKDFEAADKALKTLIEQVSERIHEEGI